MSNPFFLGKIKTMIKKSKCHLLKFLSRMLSISFRAFYIIIIIITIIFNQLFYQLLLLLPASVAQLDVRPTGDQEVSGSTPARSATFLLGG